MSSPSCRSKPIRPSAAGQGGEHRYSIADYGMTVEETRARFGDVVRCDLIERRR